MERIDTTFIREGYRVEFVDDFLATRMDGGETQFGPVQNLIAFNVTLTWKIPVELLQGLVESLSTVLPVIIPLVIHTAPAGIGNYIDCVCWRHPNSLDVRPESATTMFVSASFYGMRETDLGG